MTSRKPDKRIGGFVQSYFVEAMIGWGGSSKVYRVRHSETLKHAAMKVISKPKSKIGEIQKAFAECSILESLDHVNIVKMYEWFQTEKKIFIFMELARDGDLLEFVNERGVVPEPLLRKWFVQLVQVLQYTHSRGLVHKDIKLDNILLDGDRILLADWGYAHEWRRGYSCQRYAGTQGYWAPEILAEKPFEGPEVDCWSLGVTLYAMAVGRLPFNRESPTYFDDLMQGRYYLSPHLPNDLRTILYGLMTVDPIARFNLNDIADTDYYRQALPNTSGSLSSSPQTPSSTPSISPRPQSPPPQPIASATGPLASPSTTITTTSAQSIPPQRPISPSSPSSSHLHVTTHASRSTSPEPATDSSSRSHTRSKSPAVKHSNIKLSELHNKDEQSSTYGILDRSPREPPASEASTPNRSRANSSDLTSEAPSRRMSLPESPDGVAELVLSRSFSPADKPAERPQGTMRRLLGLFKLKEAKEKEKEAKEEKKEEEKAERKDSKKTKNAKKTSPSPGPISKKEKEKEKNSKR